MSRLGRIGIGLFFVIGIAVWLGAIWLVFQPDPMLLNWPEPLVAPPAKR
jgi:hypothetical protein